MKTINTLLKITIVLLLVNCNRFLDEKSDSKLATAETLAANQAMLDESSAVASNATSGEIAADDIYVNDADFNTMSDESMKRLYSWEPDYVSQTTGNDWQLCFSRINIFNTVLFNLKQYSLSDTDSVEGQALLLRASVYLEAAQVWCLAYDKNTAATVLGLPLRLEPDMNTPSVRSTLQETYTQILADLHRALSLLPVDQIATIRPSRVTALAYLSRVYLYMGDYINALKYGKEALSYNLTLLNYNSLNPAAAYPFNDKNVEIILPTYMSYSPFLATTKAKINDELYRSYNVNDLRKTIFFKILANGEILFKGNYKGSTTRMSCISTDEIYLNIAEAQAYLDDKTSAMRTLNDLLVTRWKTGTFIELAASTRAQALQTIRAERRKELLFRAMRWSDIKRYNREGANLTLNKTINGKLITLPSNDLRYAIAIPEDIIKMTGMPQNPR